MRRPAGGCTALHYTVFYCTLYSVQCLVLYTVLYTVLYCTVYSVQCTVYGTRHCTVLYCNIMYILLYCALLYVELYCTVHCTLLYCNIMYTVMYCAVLSLYCTVHGEVVTVFTILHALNTGMMCSVYTKHKTTYHSIQHTKYCTYVHYTISHTPHCTVPPVSNSPLCTVYSIH